MINIAITQRIIENGMYSEIRDALDVRWSEFCSSLDILPIILPTHSDFRHYFEAIQISGIILTGGNDLSTISDNQYSIKRDAFEKDLLTFALERQLPVFAVCRGMQLVGEYFGSWVVPVEGHAATRHAIYVAAEGGTADLLRNVREVNSYHSFGLRNVPERFTLLAKSSDGVVEAMENRLNKIYCQMWHPEREESFSTVEHAILRELLGIKEDIK